MRDYKLDCVIGSATVSGLLCMDSDIYAVYYDIHGTNVLLKRIG